MRKILKLSPVISYFPQSFLVVHFKFRLQKTTLAAYLSVYGLQEAPSLSSHLSFHLEKNYAAIEKKPYW